MLSRRLSSFVAALVFLAGCSSSSGSSSAGSTFNPAGAVAYYTTAYGGSMSIALWSTPPNCMSGGTPTNGESVLLLVVPGNPTVAKTYTVTTGGPPMPPIAEWEIPAGSLYEDVYTIGTITIESVSSTKVAGTYSINLVPSGSPKGGFTMGSSTGSFSAPICPTP